VKLVGISAVSFASDDGWVPLAQVAIEENGMIDIHRIESGDADLRLGSREEANNFALELAREWMHQTLSHQGQDVERAAERVGE
jgi:hypothetical protein